MHAGITDPDEPDLRARPAGEQRVRRGGPVISQSEISRFNIDGDDFPCAARCELGTHVAGINLVPKSGEFFFAVSGLSHDYLLHPFLESR